MMVVPAFSFAIMAMFASAISAQVKVVSNGNVKMSKDLTVSGVTKIKLVNENDVTVRPLSMVGTPSNKIANLNPILFKAMELRPQGNVVIASGTTNVIYKDFVILDSGFEVKLGSEFNVTPRI